MGAVYGKGAARGCARAGRKKWKSKRDVKIDAENLMRSLLQRKAYGVAQCFHGDNFNGVFAIG